MSSHQPPAPRSPRRARIAWAFAGAAVLLSLLALIVVLEDLGGRNKNVTALTAALNMITGLLSLVGAIGYSLRRRWGLLSFGLSVLGHISAHGLLIISAINLNRVSISSIGGLSVIPILAAGTWIGMIWERRKTGWA